MPGLDGFDTAEPSAAGEATRHIPIIFITAISKEQRHVFRGYEAGAVDYLIKPFDHDILKNKVRVFVDMHRQRLAVQRAGEALARTVAELRNSSRALSDSRARYQSLFNSMLNGFVLLSMEEGAALPQARVLEVNPAMERMMDRPREMLVDRTVSELLPNLEGHLRDFTAEVARSGRSGLVETYVADLRRWLRIQAYVPGPGLLALVAEPGGIASSIAEAMNYQFGFEVSQTWFYQLLQKWFALLVVVGIVSLWLLTCVLIVQPDEHAVIERFGRQVNAASPYGPGFYWKLPWPIDVARKYETSRLHQIIVGFKQFDAEPVPHREDAAQVALWSDDRHFGQPHFDFVIPVPPRVADGELTAAEQALADEFALSAAAQALPVNLVRMDVAVQYRIDVGRLAQYTQRCDRPEDYLRNIAWEEAVRYVAGWDVFALLGEKYGTAGSELQVRINARLQELELGLEVVYVGVQNVHPAPDVAKEFRKVITAEQEKVASIRQALVKENETLSRVAGDRDTARALAQALAKRNPNQIRFDQAGLLLQHVDGAALSQVEAEFGALEAHFTRVIVARWRLEQAEDAQHQVQLDFELGLGRDVAERAAAVAAMEPAADERARVEAELGAAWLALAAAAAAQLDEEALRALRDRVAAQAALRFWNDRLEALLPRLQGQAAATLAEAQATRWTEEMGHAQELARMQGERSAYRAAPRVYKVRKYLETLVNGLKDKRKFFLAFDQTDRQVRVRYIAEEKARADTASFPSRIQR